MAVVTRLMHHFISVWVCWGMVNDLRGKNLSSPTATSDSENAMACTPRVVADPATTDVSASKAISSPRSARCKDPGGMTRYKLSLAYEGTDFHGWQKQPGLSPQSPPLRTVAGVVEEALQRLLRQPITLVGASRTDAGVHAHGQVAHFDAVTPIPLDRLVHAINSRLPDDVEARRVEAVRCGFDAIRDAKSKIYRYRIFNTDRRPLEWRRCVWHCWNRLDVDAMQNAAQRFVGKHDFAGFAAAGHGRQTTVREILACTVRLVAGPGLTGVRGAEIAENPKVPDMLGVPLGNAEIPLIDIEVQGTGFLYNMVRIMAGTLVEVGRGRFSPDIVDDVLKCGDRSQAGPTLPPQGLRLEKIYY